MIQVSIARQSNPRANWQIDSPSRSLAIRWARLLGNKTETIRIAGPIRANGHHTSPGEAYRTVSAPNATISPSQPSSRDGLLGIRLEGARIDLRLELRISAHGIVPSLLPLT